ncbi:apolipoprotein N-acyltransferase [Erythrobacter sp. Alg231-14]|uniref:apolipoprotein N-acyltransferase n=1 Tax=Erythrobacter sp. Alg231-14 TaxID=1922225 RepID=UPI00307B16AA
MSEATTMPTTGSTMLSVLINLWVKAVAVSEGRPLWIAGALGLIVALGYPPFHAWWIALPALSLFVALLKSAPSKRAAFWRGWVFGWFHLTLANNWIATAFTHQAKMPEVLGWIAVPLLCLYLAVYPGLAALAAHWCAHRFNNRIAQRIDFMAFSALFAASWIVSEWLRSWVFTGYPWPPLGLILLGGWDSPGLASLLPWIGTYALSGLAILVAALGAQLFRKNGLSALRRALLVFGFASIVVVLPMVWTVDVTDDSSIRYTLVQPLIPQDEINDGSKFEEQFQRTANLTRPGNDQSRLILWPESAIPDYLEEGYPERYYRQTTAGADPLFARQRIASVIGPDATLLTGVVNLNIGEREPGWIAAVSARNSVVALDGTGDLTHHYAKSHLVPYGEYLPLEWALGRLGLARLTAGSIPYIPGPGPQTLDLAVHGRAGIQICYEIVFSGQVVDRDDRPDYIFNPSNDGWFGSWGPPQHLAQARMRAIEEGLPVLRSTTTGISAVIDANGSVRQSIALGEADKRDGFVPAAHAPTLFSRFGNALPLAWAGLLVLLSLGLPRLLALRAGQG